MRGNWRGAARKPMTAPPTRVRGKVRIRVERCKGCEFCVVFCPQGVLVLSEELNPKGYHYPLVVKDECINCSLCLSLCPEYAIFSRPVTARKDAAKDDGAARATQGGSNS